MSWIELKKLDGDSLILRSELIVSVEAVMTTLGDHTSVLVENGARYDVTASPGEVMQKIFNPKLELFAEP